MGLVIEQGFIYIVDMDYSVIQFWDIYSIGAFNILFIAVTQR